jgi:Arc/MetJ-type ribon-helix-helix transcriptional regulator
MEFGLFSESRVAPDVLHTCRSRITLSSMKSMTVRLPDGLVAQIEAESRARKLSKSDVVRERLRRSVVSKRRRADALHAIADLVGSVDGLPADLSARKKTFLTTLGYGRKRSR